MTAHIRELFDLSGRAAIVTGGSRGLGREMAEGLAEYTNRVICQELGLNGQRGRRYSWGYPAIPDLADHAKVFELLPVASSIGVELTEAYQLVPEQSTAAIVVHHPQATYFAVRVPSTETLTAPA